MLLLESVIHLWPVGNVLLVVR